MKDTNAAMLAALQAVAPGYEIRVDRDDGMAVSVAYRKGDGWWKTFMVAHRQDNRNHPDPVIRMAAFMEIIPQGEVFIKFEQRIEWAVAELKRRINAT